MSKFYISFLIVVFLFFFMPSIHSQEKEGDDGDQGEEHLQGGDRDGDEADESTSHHFNLTVLTHPFTETM